MNLARPFATCTNRNIYIYIYIYRIVEVKRCIEEITGIANPNLVQEVLVPLLVSNGNNILNEMQEGSDNSFFLLPEGYPLYNCMRGI